MGSSGGIIADLQDWGSNEWLLPAASSTQGVGLTEGLLLLCPIWIPRTRTVNAFEIEVITTAGAAGSVVRVGVFRDTNSDGIPDSLVADMGTVAGTSIAVVRGTPSTYSLSKGAYWIGTVGQGAPATQPTLRGAVLALQTRQPGGSASASVSLGWRFQLAGVTGAFAASISPSLAIGNAPRVALRSA